MELEIKADAPAFENPVSQLCTESQMRTRAYRFWAEKIREPPLFHRKQWEYCYILQALAESGALAPSRRGIGFGVGREPLSAVFASYGCSVVATDQAREIASSVGWTRTNEHAEALSDLNERGICPAELFAEFVQFEEADMNHIPREWTGFDFTWSSCALEHLGSIERGWEFVRNSLDCIRPGGTAVHTTEYNVFSDDKTLDSGDTVLFRKRDILTLAESLIRDGHYLVLNLNHGTGEFDRYVDLPPYGRQPHLKLQIDQFTTTSIGFIIRKGGR